MPPKLHISLIFLLLHITAAISTTISGGGTWRLLHDNIGIVAMHMQLLHNDRVVIYDRTDFGPSNLTLPKCIPNISDCTAHSIEYDPARNSFRALTVATDVWCSSGSVSPNGTLIQTGGNKHGSRVVRTMQPCRAETALFCDWQEHDNQLLARRWYSTNHILPDGRLIVMGGRRSFNYEFYPKSEHSRSLYNLRFLAHTNDKNIENNLYPFVFLNSDGNLFIFANTKSILFDYATNKAVRTYPDLPGGSRNYPSTGSAVLLPIRNSTNLEIMVCGGTPKDNFVKAKFHKQFVGALNSCGRIKINDPDPNWAMENMPMPRVMGDMLILPNGRVLIINGAGSGSAGWEYGKNPVLTPVLYNPGSEPGSRFKLQNPTTIARMYHSTAIVLRDGRVLVGGSNPHDKYKFTNVNYPTELRLESFEPSYLGSGVTRFRPEILGPASYSKLRYGDGVKIRFRVPGGLVANSTVEVTLFSPPFNTHSFSMNHRMVVLGAVGGVTALGECVYELTVTAPKTVFIAPRGFYLMFVVHQDIPSVGIWVQI